MTQHRADRQAGRTGSSILKPGEPIGLIAGNGELPSAFSREAKRRGHPLYIVGVEGEAPKSLARWGTETKFLPVGRLGALLAFFKKHQVRWAAMEGQVHLSHLFRIAFVPGQVDLKAISLLLRQKDRSGPAMMKAVAGELEKSGTRLLDCRTFLDTLVAEEGVLTRTRPKGEAADTIPFGLVQARRFSEWKVGQTLVVRRRAVVAVEAAEGTDETILRGGRVGRPGTVVIKVAGPSHDWRFDVPTVGPATILALVRAQAAGMVVEAGAAFILQRDKTLALADRHHLFLQAVRR